MHSIHFTSTATIAMTTTINGGGGVTNNKSTTVEPGQLAELMKQPIDSASFGGLVIIDCRRFLDYNTLHIRNAINICCSKLIRKRLQENKMSIFDILRANSCDPDADSTPMPEMCCSVAPPPSAQLIGRHQLDVVLYADRCRSACGRTAAEHCAVRKIQEDASFLAMLQDKLSANSKFRSVRILKGGFVDFQSRYPELCEGASGVGGGLAGSGSSSSMGSPAGSVRSSIMVGGPSGLGVSNKLSLSTLSQPCLPVSNQGPTKILPFLYLGSQQDAMDQETLGKYGIDYVLNMSVSCPKPEFVQDEHFMRIAVNDSHSEKLLPYFERAFEFLDKVKEANSCVLVHCLAGISRSPTLAIAFVMRHLHISSEEAYRYVKEKRPAISPNFNFLGQLLEYEKQLTAVRQTELLQPQQQQGLRQGFNSLSSPTVKADRPSTACSTSKVQIVSAENPLFRAALPGMPKQRRPPRRVSLSEKDEDQLASCPQTAPAVVNHDFITA